MTPEYNVVEDTVEFVTGTYKGIKFKYGGVKLVPDYEEDKLTLSFDYEILSDVKPPPTYIDEFVQKIGGILTELINEQLQTNSVVYTNGV